MTKIKLELEETDLYNSLKSIIKHSNSEEIARALTSIIAPHEKLTSIFFKTYFGGSAPPVLSEGTMVTVNPNKLSYKTNVEGMKRLGLLNISGHATAIIKEFRGFHESHNYYVNFMNVDDNDNKSYEDTGFISYQDVITVIEEL
jgi:hypothetical protein